MSNIYRQIDPELRLAGRLMKLAVRPNLLGFKLIHWMSSKATGNGMKGADASTIWIERSADPGSIRTRVFRPLDTSENLPIVLYLHGGGYAMQVPDMKAYQRMFRGWMKSRPCVVVAPDYRVSLKEPYPAALHDCYDALCWLKHNAAKIGGKTDQIFVIGDSAGGGLTVATCLMARDKGEVNVAFQMPLYPMIDHRQTNPSAVDNRMPGWNSKHNKLGWELYLRGLHERGVEIPAYASPVMAESYKGMPPAATFVGDLDLFHDETTEYVERLKADGVPVKYKVFPGGFHGFDQAVPQASVSRASFAFMVDAYTHAIDHYTAPQTS